MGFGAVQAQTGTESQKFWVFFKDKRIYAPAEKSAALTKARQRLSKRALRRRAKVRPAHALVDERDLPVSPHYVNALERLGLEPVVVSNWLNAVSVVLDSAQRERVRRLPFVRKVQPVARARRNRSRPPSVAQPRAVQKTGLRSAFDYGPSLNQNRLINVLPVHELGVIGKGVWIGLLDTGFKVRDHEAFEGLEVAAQHDFINDDDVTEDQPGDPPGQQNHGTQTLSAVGGFKQGQLIGTAFGATFVLAKTEILPPPDRPEEEDFWVAGLEWMESLGVDVVSSSLGYLDFYTPADMDGNTAVTTVAADLAVARGVVVVNSAGNEGGDTSWKIIIAPADGDSVIAVGAVTPEGLLASFSSVGPTADGRIKPDVVAQGTSVYLASPASERLPSPYGFGAGTSFSCPQVAGVAALVLSAHPYLTPMEVRDALRLTASQAATPDNLMGWGIVDAYEAVLFHGLAFSNSPQVSVVNNDDLEISIKIASKEGVDASRTFLVYQKPGEVASDSVSMFRGQARDEFVGTIPGFTGEVIRFYFVSADSSGRRATHPYNAPDSTFAFPEAPVSVAGPTSRPPKTFQLAQNYPNPFNPGTTLAFTLSEPAQVSLTIYNVLGQPVRTLLKRVWKPAGRYRVVWDGRDDADNPVAGGIYFYTLRSERLTQTRKMILIR